MRVPHVFFGTWPILLWSCLVIGCAPSARPAPPAHLRPEVTAVHPTKRTIVRLSGQPGFVEAYEQTAIYSKVSGFVDQWNADIGDPIRAGMILARLNVPDLVAELLEKEAEAAYDEVRIRVAKELVRVAEENWQTARSQVRQAEADLGRYTAEVAYWSADYKRIHELYVMKAVSQPADEASYKHMQATMASQRAAEAGIEVARANAVARKADYDKSRIDVDAALARAEVARAAVRRLSAVVGYATLKAPYDGVVVVRNVNTGDFVQPAGGDRSAPRDNTGMARLGSHPVYVVARTDKVRVFLDVPEMEASGVYSAALVYPPSVVAGLVARLGSSLAQGPWPGAGQFFPGQGKKLPGSKARVTIQALHDQEFSGEITRTSWALNAKSRTLRAEIDLDNPGRRILPNMYAFGTVELRRTNVWAIPLQAVVQRGNDNCCYVLEEGKSVQLPLQLGINDGTWVEVVARRSGSSWQPLDGSEQILLGELPELSDGQPVRLSEPSAVPE